ncbi:hypothetical protein B0T19DRAFT_62697 [Cercophora scortea]|uniref:Uncharacterized protein n=1 Tax=Cercophora scortea TaxID=314031 RepID=A0AAE0MLN5_9PEZI|nr:hypothetical protein B0T19DRAFT_62697 [Cercophora scortea]
MAPLWKSGVSGSRPKAVSHRSIRGTISGPIPIPAAVDKDDDEFPIRNPGSARAVTTNDDEFPIRIPGAGIASPIPPDEPDTTPEEQPGNHRLDEKPDPESEHGTVEDEDEVPDEGHRQVTPPASQPALGVVSESGHVHQGPVPEAPIAPPPAPLSGSGESTGGRVSRTPPQRPSPQRSIPERTSPERVSPTTPTRSMTSPPARPTTNPFPNAVRYSTLSESPSVKTGQPQRKKSTLRSALGRLFGRSKKKNTSSSIQESPGTPGRDSLPSGPSQHRSDPTALNRTKEVSPKRSASLPITEYDRPLRSHSIGPDDIMAIESARNSLQAEAGTGPLNRRRAATTTTGRLLPPRLRNSEWGAGLSPRPASSSRLASHGDPEDPDEIGRAITSDSDNGLRRRSRSLSGLNNIAGARPGTRRRSDEIRYWRESYDPGFMSPLSSNAPDGDVDDTGVVDISAPESPVAERPPKTPPQPFNFGSLTNEMVGMKITQAASIETRISNLETRSRKLERVVNQLCHTVPGFRAPLSEGPVAQKGDLLPGYYGRSADQAGFAYTTATPPPVPAIYHSKDVKDTPRFSDSRQSVETDAHSQTSFGDAPTFIDSLHPPSSSATQSQSQSLTATAPAPPTIHSLGRPTSTSTVRGAASLPTMGRDISDDETYASLASQLEVERAARLALEAQVKKLSERLNTLSTTMFAMVRDPTKSRSQERLTPSVGGNSPLLHVPQQTLLSVPAVKALSVFETDDEDEIDVKEISQAGTDEGDDAIEDSFQTPREEKPLNFGAFGEELRPDDAGDVEDLDEDDPKRKKAARTLSLSQLTLGKGQRTQI